MSGMGRFLVCLVTCLLIAAPVSGQSVTSYTATIYGNSTFGTRTAVLPVATVCGLPQAPPSGSLAWDDPAGGTCFWAALQANLPTGSYEVTLRATNSIGTSAESARLPFSVAPATPAPSPPAVPTGVRIIP